MQIIVTTKSFEQADGAFDYLIPSLEKSMEGLIVQLAVLSEPHIDISKLCAIHITEDYERELFEFQKKHGHKQYRTKNKIARGAAQVIKISNALESGENGFHIFIDKCIPFTILALQVFENISPNDKRISDELIEQLKSEKNDYIRIVRHEMAHVEDETNQERFRWLQSALIGFNVKNQLRNDALRLWEEFYACRRSVFQYDDFSIKKEVDSLIPNLEKAENEICNLRQQFLKKEIDLNLFVDRFHDYIRSAFIYGCYFMGHLNITFSFFDEKGFTFDILPSKFMFHFKELWIALRKMDESYPRWIGPEIFDEVVDILQRTIEDYGVYMSDDSGSIYYKICYNEEDYE